MCDHRVAPADGWKAGPVHVQREDPRDRRLYGIEIGLTCRLDMDQPIGPLLGVRGDRSAVAIHRKGQVEVAHGLTMIGGRRESLRKSACSRRAKKARECPRGRPRLLIVVGRYSVDRGIDA